MYILLEFKNAKLIRTHFKTKDRTSSFGLPSTDRSSFKNFVEPITKFQIANMLHVIMGERPVNTQRACLYNSQPWIDLLAENSYIRYTTPKIVRIKGKEPDYPKEKITISKSAWNSWNVGTVNWNIIRNFCDSNFNTILNELKQIYNDPEAIPFKDIIEDVSSNYTNTDKYDNLFNAIKRIKGLDALVDILKGNRGSVNNKKCTSTKRGTALTFNRSVDEAQFLSGEILFEVDDNILEIIKTHYKGTCTLLDNGLVNIVKVMEDDQISKSFFNDFERVGNISIDKVK